MNNYKHGDICGYTRRKQANFPDSIRLEIGPACMIVNLTTKVEAIAVYVS
jgi:hypothetical protein